MRKLLFLFLAFVLLFFVSCESQDEMQDQNLEATNSRLVELQSMHVYNYVNELGSTPLEKKRLALLELKDVLPLVVENEQAHNELLGVIKNPLYYDNYVSLDDLLHYDSSILYKVADISSFSKGSFKNASECP